MVNAQGSVLVLDLSNLFGISEVTIRADLRLLEEKGLLTRFHGGAARPGSNLTEGDNLEVVLEDRYQLASDPKKRIAQAAVAMISDYSADCRGAGTYDQYYGNYQQSARGVYAIRKQRYHAGRVRWHRAP